MGVIRKEDDGRYRLDGEILNDGEWVMMLHDRMGKKTLRPETGTRVAMTARAWLYGEIKLGPDGYYFLWIDIDPNRPGKPIGLIDGMQLKRREKPQEEEDRWEDPPKKPKRTHS